MPGCRTILPTPTSGYGETQCPRCEGQLWHLALVAGPPFFVRRPSDTIYDLMAAVADPSRELTAAHMETLLKDADSFDVVELLSDFEANLHS
ncbi:MAG TPA: hypothetical protein VJ063_09670 [Verrucomicrobiae bacterium]|nr:hypothetical protein [Verrucomicrobiae bacterium]